ncbi:hypothetical protein [Methanocaldococcus sp.]|uniref:hypothetical protein n=1 Tax=Methanocaldococcus sp. TaxID=2152917 RepID=UPI00262B23E7|nr:hypothetical protein [Methanocaldococcus sp.]MCQ6254747.1 hypothetical protein [Methanocaldococcus sp.]
MFEFIHSVKRNIDFSPKIIEQKLLKRCFWEWHAGESGTPVESSGGSFGISYSGGFVESSSGDSGGGSRSSQTSRTDDDSGRTTEGENGGKDYYIDTYTDNSGQKHTVIKDSSGNIVAFTNQKDAQSVLKKFQSGEIKPDAEVITEDTSTGKWYSATFNGSSSTKGVTTNDIIYLGKKTGSSHIDMNNTKVKVGNSQTMSAIDFAKNYEPLKIGNKIVILQQSDYSRLQQTLQKYPNAKITAKNGQIQIMYSTPITVKPKTDVNLNNFFDVSNVKPNLQNGLYLAPKVEISNLPSLEAYSGSEIVGKNQTVSDYLSRNPSNNEIHAINVFETINTEPEISVVSNPNLVSNVKYTGVDEFSSVGIYISQTNKQQIQNRVNKDIEEYNKLPGRHALTKAETSIVEGLGHIGKTIAGTLGEIAGKSAGYFISGAGEFVDGTIYATGVSILKGNPKYLRAEGEMLLEGGKQTLKSLAKTVSYPFLKATEKYTGIKTPELTTDDVAMTLATVAPVGLAKIRSISIESPFKTSQSITSPSLPTPKMPKNTIVEVGVSPGGKPYVIKTNERGVPIKTWADVDVKVPTLEEQLVQKSTIPDYTESLTLTNKNAIYKREFNPSTGVYSETLSYIAGERRNTITHQFDLSKVVPTRYITLTSETPFKKQSMSIALNRGEFVQSLTYQNAVTGERGIKARYISHDITRLYELNKMDTLLPPAPDVINRRPFAEVPKQYPSEIPKPKIENNIIDLTNIDFEKIEQTKIEHKFELKPPAQRGRIFTVDEILKKEKTAGGQSVKTGSKTLQIEKTKTTTKEKTIPKTEENVIDLTKIDFRTLEKEATKTSIKQKTVPKVAEKSAPVPLLLPKVATIPKPVEKVKPILKPIQKPKTLEKPLIVPKIVEIPAQKFKVGLAFAPATLEKTAFTPKESTIEKTALSFTQSKTLANSLTSTQQITTPTFTTPSVDIKFKPPKLKLNVKLGSSIGGSGSSKRGKWAKLVTWF